MTPMAEVLSKVRKKTAEGFHQEPSDMVWVGKRKQLWQKSPLGHSNTSFSTDLFF
jgi:hypothetical protein